MALLPVAVQQFLDENGDPYAGGQLFILTAGHSDPDDPLQQLQLFDAATMIDPTDVIPNPVILNAAGRTTSDGSAESSVYVDASSVDIVLRDVNDVDIFTILALALSDIATVGVGQAIHIFGGDGNWEHYNTAYPSGAGLDKLLIGSSPWSITGTGLGGTFILEAEIVAPLGGSGSVSLFNLTAAPDTLITGSTATGGSVAGATVQSGTPFTLSAAGENNYGVKVLAGSATAPVSVRNVRLIQETTT